MQDGPPQPKQPTFFENLEIARAITMFAALTMMVFFRRRLGYRLMNPLWLLGVGAALFVIGLFFPQPGRNPGAPGGLEAFAVLFVAMGLWHKLAAWQEIRKGNPDHSYSTGISFIERFPLPRFLRVHRRANRYLDPIVLVSIGWCIRQYGSVPVGTWWIFAAFCLGFYEQDIYRKAVHRDLDVADGLVAAEIQSETAKHFEKPRAQQSAAEQPAIPTGMGADILKRAKERQRFHN